MKVRAYNLCERLEDINSGGSQSGKLTKSDLVRNSWPFQQSVCTGNTDC